MGSIVSKRYARALFAIGKAAGEKDLKAYGKELAGIADIMGSSPDLQRVFRNPVFSAQQKKAVVESMLAKIKASAMVSNFCKLLAEKDRLDLLPDIQKVYSAMLDAEEGVVRGQLTTVIELTDKKQKEIIKQLEEQSKSKVKLDFTVDEDILGGIVLSVGSKAFDASLRAQLDILKENIKRGE